MFNLQVAFVILDTDWNPPDGWSNASVCIIVDVIMALEWKYQWVKDGHRTPEHEKSTYTGVVLQESVRIALTYAALNGLEVCTSDIQNSYLQSPSYEKHFIICGPEFGLENVGKKALIIRALYGRKRAGTAYWIHVRSTIDKMGYESCKDDPDVCFSSAMKDDGRD